jgi:putative transposase
MVDRTATLSLSRQLSLLGVSKSSYYHSIAERPDPDAFLKHLVLLVYRERPHYGYRRIAVELAVKYDTHVGEGKVRGVMKALGLRAIIRRRRIVTTVSDPDNRVFPNLLSDLSLTRSNQAWGTDITYVGVSGQRAYVVSIKDLYSRKVLAWRTSNTMDASFCIEALETALERYGPPEIFHSDQGSQFTCRKLQNMVLEAGADISHCGKGRAADNGQVENLWYSLKHECLNHEELRTLPQLRKAVNRYFIYYNGDRPHSSLGYRYPNAVYREGLAGAA